MRNIFLALLLLNLGFVGWRYWIAGSDATNPLPVKRPVGPPIVLASELSEQERTTLQVAVSESAPAAISREQLEQMPLAATRACISVGPLFNDSEADEVIARLEDAGIEPARRVTEGDVWVGHWVHSPAYASRREAREVVAKMEESGLNDVYVMSDDETPNSISLGVFSELLRAQSRLDEVRKLDFEAQITQRYREGSIYWVDFEKPALDSAISHDFQYLPGRITRAEELPCGRVMAEAPASDTDAGAGQTSDVPSPAPAAEPQSTPPDGETTP